MSFLCCYLLRDVTLGTTTAKYAGKKLEVELRNIECNMLMCVDWQRLVAVGRKQHEQLRTLNVSQTTNSVCKCTRQTFRALS